MPRLRPRYCPHGCGRVLCYGPLLPYLLARCHCGREVNGGGDEYWKTKEEALAADRRMGVEDA